MICADSRSKVNSFFRNVSIPDQHVLAEPQIGPEYREGKHELTDIMKVLFVGELQIALILKIYYEIMLLELYQPPSYWRMCTSYTWCCTSVDRYSSTTTMEQLTLLLKRTIRYIKPQIRCYSRYIYDGLPHLVKDYCR